MNDEVSALENMFRLLHAYENHEYITLDSRLFSRKLLLYLYEDGAFPGTPYNHGDGRRDYQFLLDMFNAHNDSISRAQQGNTILLLRQGYDEKQAIEEFEVFRKTLSNTPTYKQDTPKVITAKDGLDSVDIDRSLLLTRLGHVRWKYNYGSESDYTYIKRNIKSLTHISSHLPFEQLYFLIHELYTTFPRLIVSDKPGVIFPI